MMLILMMALVSLVVSDYDRPNKRTKRGGELDGGRKRAGINDHSAATDKSLAKYETFFMSKNPNF